MYGRWRGGRSEPCSLHRTARIGRRHPRPQRRAVLRWPGGPSPGRGAAGERGARRTTGDRSAPRSRAARVPGFPAARFTTGDGTGQVPAQRSGSARTHGDTGRARPRRTASCRPATLRPAAAGRSRSPTPAHRPRPRSASRRTPERSDPERSGPPGDRPERSGPPDGSAARTGPDHHAYHRPGRSCPRHASGPGRSEPGPSIAVRRRHARPPPPARRVRRRADDGHECAGRAQARRHRLRRP